jgi:hypothetical protein
MLRSQLLAIFAHFRQKKLAFKNIWRFSRLKTFGDFRSFSAKKLALKNWRFKKLALKKLMMWSNFCKN